MNGMRRNAENELMCEAWSGRNDEKETKNRKNHLIAGEDGKNGIRVEELD